MSSAVTGGPDLFVGLPHTAPQHFTLYFYAALLRILDQVSRHFGSAEVANEKFPFLGGYFEEIQARGLEQGSFAEAHAGWHAALHAWERASARRLPLLALSGAAGLSYDELVILAQIGLPEEDPRFGLVFDAMQGGGGERRPTPGLLGSGWLSDETVDPRGAVQRLQALGLVEPASDGPGLRPCGIAWDVIRGAELTTRGWLRYRPPETLPKLNALTLPADIRFACEKLPIVLASGAVGAVILRGPRHNGRTTLACALARSLGKGAVQVTGLTDPVDARWRTSAAVACLADAVMIVGAEPGPSETFELPDLPELGVPCFTILGTSGGVAGALADRAITLRLPLPDRPARERLWGGELGYQGAALGGMRMTSGNIVRAARVARTTSALRGVPPDVEDLRAAVRTLERPGLESLARPVAATGDWSRLAVSSETFTELTALAARCRQRERLVTVAGQAFAELGPGVRALFKGPSGTGKTLAARILAGALSMDLYRIDLAAVVNKYIGETEKNLERVFARAEELDVILALDEGDSLLTQRTGVHSANDRFANLETNYLLQRLESYEGIILITTNAADRIDAAFHRRMDVVVDFGLPEAGERWAIWQLHLPADHEIELELVRSVAQRCALSGGQIRNASLHASLLAVESEAPLRWEHLEAAIEREYRKQGAMSPLRTRNAIR